MNANVSLMAENVTRIKIGITNKCRCECKNPKEHHVCKKSYICTATCTCKKGKYLGSIIDTSVITCDEIINAPESALTTVPTNQVK